MLIPGKMAEKMTNETIASTWRAIDVLLTRSRKFWQLRPFEHLQPPWQAENLALTEWLAAFSLAEIEALDMQPEKLAIEIQSFIPEISKLTQLSRLSRLPHRDIVFKPRLKSGIPGRKWAQIEGFASTIPKIKLPVLEWCAGKGHLGRLLANCDGIPVKSLEINTQLCKKGEKMAEKVAVKMAFFPVDVLSEPTAKHLEANQHVVALHACGVLHETLLQKSVAKKSRHISLSPCCYYKITGEQYVPLSSIGKQTNLKLSRFDLQLPILETVTAPKRKRRLRNREMDWRLGFDLLQRELYEEDRYLTVPPVKESLLNTDFPAFCEWAAKQRNIILPQKIDFAHYLALGKIRRVDVARMELVRHAFRRPLELWLVLEKALFLIENDYAVRIGTFCERQETPRNIMILAVFE